MSEKPVYTYKDLEKVYKLGGYELIDSYFVGIRKTKKDILSSEGKKIWTRYLHWRWCKNHPEFIKKQNKYYFDKYKTEKPHKCICKRCGQEFDAPRPYYKLCMKCPTKTQLKKKEIQFRKDRKKMIAEQAVAMYKTGLYTQQYIADFFGTYQRQISNWVNSARKKLTKEKK